MSNMNRYLSAMGNHAGVRTAKESVDEAKTGKISDKEFEDKIFDKMAELMPAVGVGYNLTSSEIKRAVKTSPVMRKKFDALYSEMKKSLEAKRSSMKEDADFLEEANMRGKTYYEIGGDRYDGGVVFNVYVKGKHVHSDILDGDQDFEYKKKKYNYIDKVMDAIAKDNGLKSHKDFKRIELESYVDGQVLPENELNEAIKIPLATFADKLSKDMSKELTKIKKNAGHNKPTASPAHQKMLDNAAKSILDTLKKIYLEV